MEDCVKIRYKIFEFLKIRFLGIMVQIWVKSSASDKFLLSFEKYYLISKMNKFVRKSDKFCQIFC